MKYQDLRSKRSRGFTLLELIVVITIIGILGTLVVVRVSGLIGVSQDTKIKNDLQAIVNAATYFHARTGYYPQSLEELKAGKDQNGNDTGVQLPDVTKDPWGNEYVYELRDGKPKAYCFGKDAVEGGEGENKDYEYPEASTPMY